MARASGFSSSSGPVFPGASAGHAAGYESSWRVESAFISLF
jgi:hypothetical protein